MTVPIKVILADTSIWIDHLRYGNEAFVALLTERQIAWHPFVLGEVALGNLKNRAKVLATIQNLPSATVADDREVLYFINRHNLAGTGIGYIDAHLLAATALHHSARLWTHDKKLAAAAARLELAYTFN